MSKIIELTPTLAIVADKISIVDIDEKNHNNVRIFFLGASEIYSVRCDDEESAANLCKHIISELKND